MDVNEHKLHFCMLNNVVQSLFFKCICINIYTYTVPEMDGRQMRLISYSGDQKLLQIR